MTATRRVLREMVAADVPEVVGVQEPAAVAGLSAVFPQDRFPFPRQAIADRWLAEVAETGTHCFVIDQDGSVAGFAAVRGDEVLHFGVALEEWGSGLAVVAHDELLDIMRGHGATRAWLNVYAGNARGLRFWQRLGWTPTGARERGSFPPYAELLTYEKAL